MGKISGVVKYDVLYDDKLDEEVVLEAKEGISKLKNI